MRFVNRLSAGVVAGFAVLAHVAPASAQETGGVKGTFVLKGEMPKLKPPVVNKDQAVCANPVPPNEALVVDPATKGVANVFVWISRVDPKDIPEELRKPKEDKVVVDQKGCAFIPHSVVARTGQTLVMLNADAVAHNLRTNPLKGAGINDIVTPNDRKGVEKPVGQAQILPIPMQCDIHPWMTGNMLIVDHPYATVSDAKGEFIIEGLPPGKHTFKVWQEAGGYLRGLALDDVEVTAGKVTDVGKLDVDVTKLKSLPK